MRIDLRNIRKSFERYPALGGVSLDIPSGRLVALLGPSGSGKTTLLRVIAGLESPDTGTVLFGDEDVTRRPVRARNVGFVFQHYALFEHMSVADNIAFGLRVRRVPRARIEDRVRALLALVQLDGLGARYPGQLSGGQKQRVALARALAPEPRVLLLDEPFGALDARVRHELRGWLRRLHDELHVTSVFVTHDQEEAFDVADRVVVMNRGLVEQEGAPSEILDSPASPFVMEFIGNVNVVAGRLADARAVFGPLVLPAPEPVAVEGASLAAYIRSSDIALARQANGLPHVHARVAHVRRVGLTARVALDAGEGVGSLTAEIPYDEWLALGMDRGDRIVATVKRAQVFSGDAARGA